MENAIVYSDGSCIKSVHPSLNAAGWALVALTDDGDVATAIWGQIGDGLPQTSPASEYVAGLAASDLRAREVRTDFAGLAALGSSPHEALASRKNIYSGLRVQIKGRSPHLGYAKVKGHVDPSSCTVGSQAWRDAVGNQYADQYARKGANLHPQPPQEVLDTVRREREVLHRFLVYVARAFLVGAGGPRNGLQEAPPPQASAATRFSTRCLRTLLQERRTGAMDAHGGHHRHHIWGI
jgi:hypothetical protein